MGGSGEFRGWKVAVLAVALLATTCAAYAAEGRDEKKPAPPALAPAQRIELAPLGFLPPNPTNLDLRLAWSSLNFIDPDHLLFTFHVNQLLHRRPGEWWDNDGQMIQADVIDVRTGKVVRQAKWMMHDRGRYLWALRGGEFLVRQKNDLYLTDDSLKLKPYLTFDTTLQGLEISPERSLMMVELKEVIKVPKTESEGDSPGQVPTLLGGGGTKPAEPVEKTRTEMLLIHPGERKVLAKATLRIPAAVPLMEDGIVQMLHGDTPTQWVLRKLTLGKKTDQLGNVQSSCAPHVQVLSEKVLLAMGCLPNGAKGNLVTAMSTDGDMLWHDRWGARYIWPIFEYSEDGRRFAYESLQANRDIGPMESFGDADIVGQPVGVFDTKTGKLVFVTNADPILSEGQNFTLSANGRRFAVLRGGAIEVYDLPAVSAAEPVERAKK